ncbi:MAG TPA: hypothetical protein VHF47_01740 [Acidimicrobiales bacterium]|nr:hypothetical protein [Acidimicrobiales bacterium]
MADLRLAAAAGAGALVLTGRGDAFLLAALLAGAAFDHRAAAACAAVALTLVARWGTSSLPAIAGAQSVLGPAVVVEPVAAALALVAATVALVLAAPRSPLGLVFGAAAGLVVAGPSWATVPGALVRVAAMGTGIAAVWWLQPRLPERARRHAPTFGVVAFVVAVAA